MKLVVHVRTLNLSLSVVQIQEVKSMQVSTKLNGRMEFTN